LNEGSNVKALNKQAEELRQKEEENDTRIEMERDNLLSTHSKKTTNE
jgi:hypothetical protein